mgnify:CR=1 FL=1
MFAALLRKRVPGIESSREWTALQAHPKYEPIMAAMPAIDRKKGA